MEKIVITNLGKEFTLKALTENYKYSFTKIKLSSFDYSGYNLKELESLEDIKQENEITKTYINESSKVEVLATITSENLNEGYFIKALGLYAKDENDNEILYAVSISTENADYMPQSGVNICSINFNIVVEVTDTENFTITVNALDVVTNTQLSKEIEILEEKIKYKPNNNIATIVHNIGAYPMVQVLKAKGAFGVGDFGDLCYGGSDIVTEYTRQIHVDRNTLNILVPHELNLSNPVVTEVVKGSEYSIVFDDNEENMSLVVLLR